MITKITTSWTNGSTHSMEIVFTSYGDNTSVESRISDTPWTKLEYLFTIRTSELKLLLSKL